MDKFNHLLAHRAEGFSTLWKLLDAKQKTKYVIVETGTTRQPDNWAGDGQSTRLFNAYVDLKGGIVFSVDIDKDACIAAKSLTNDNVSVVCTDSIQFLHYFPTKDKIDLLYLDSYDLDWNNPHPSSLHHLKELCACFSELSPECIIAVDDNDRGRGKGTYVVDFLTTLGYKIVYNGYQIILQKPTTH